MEYIVFVIVVALVTGWLGSYVASEKNRSSSEGFWLGFLFSFIGVLIVGMLPTKEKPVKKELTEEDIERRKELAQQGDSNFKKLLFAVISIGAILLAYSYFFGE